MHALNLQSPDVARQTLSLRSERRTVEVEAPLMRTQASSSCAGPMDKHAALNLQSPDVARQALSPRSERRTGLERTQSHFAKRGIARSGREAVIRNNIPEGGEALNYIV